MSRIPRQAQAKYFGHLPSPARSLMTWWTARNSVAQSSRLPWYNLLSSMATRVTERFSWRCRRNKPPIPSPGSLSLPATSTQTGQFAMLWKTMQNEESLHSSTRSCTVAKMRLRDGMSGINERACREISAWWACMGFQIIRPLSMRRKCCHSPAKMSITCTSALSSSCCLSSSLRIVSFISVCPCFLLSLLSLSIVVHICFLLFILDVLLPSCMSELIFHCIESCIFPIFPFFLAHMSDLSQSCLRLPLDCPHPW